MTDAAQNCLLLTFLFLLRCPGLVVPEKTVSQLSAAGCRTLWLDNGLHPDPTEENASDASETELSAERSRENPARKPGENPRENSEESSRDFSGKLSPRKKSGKTSFRENSEESSRESYSGGVLPAGKMEKAGGSDGRDEGRGESSRHELRLSMVLDVKRGGVSKGVAGSSEWLLR